MNSRDTKDTQDTCTELQNVLREKKATFSGELLFNEKLSRHTYYRIGGPADVLAVPRSLEDLHELSKAVEQTGCKYYFLGQGSNILASDSRYSGLIIKTHRLNLELSPLLTDSENTIRVGASVLVSSLLRRSSQEGWAGLEFLTGIPGTMGGVVKMNAGTHLGEAKDRIRKVSVFSFGNSLFGEKDLISIEGDQLQFKYRKNLFLAPHHLVWAVDWAITPSDPIQVKKLIDETLVRRKATQPLDFPSCGSVFKNPKETGQSAWQVIDRLGLRGHRIGEAQFAEKHSNFILNLGNAQASDVRGLIQLAKSKAQNELGITLEEEVIYLE